MGFVKVKKNVTQIAIVLVRNPGQPAICAHFIALLNYFLGELFKKNVKIFDAMCHVDRKLFA